MTGRRTTVGLTLVIAALSASVVASCRKQDAHPRFDDKANLEVTGATVTIGAASNDDGEWPMATKDFANTRFSRLDEINTANVKNLKEAWSFETHNDKGHEAAPIVVGDSMYVVTPYPNELHAFDLKKPGTPKWTFKPDPAPAAQGEACCDVVNRGAVFADGKVIFNTLDAWTVAVDANTGKEAWRTQLGDVHKGETMTMAPMVAKGKVLVGNSGGEMGVRGWLTALDVATGKVAWRAYSTGPDADVLIGPEFKPYYGAERGVDLGVKTWPPEKWKIGGGTVWGFLAYDPELDLVYYGTANPGPWNPDVRPGDNKWTAGVFARHPEDGHAVWFYQFSPHDLYDYDGINEMVLVELVVNGQKRKVILHADRDGYVYMIDRTSGEVLSAQPFHVVTTTMGIDKKSGQPLHALDKAPGFGRVVRDICPGAPGGKDWQPTAFSPRTGYLYIPHQNLCQDEEGTEANYIAGTPYVGANVIMKPGPGGHKGEFDAWDPVAGKKVWSLKETFPVWSGTVATAGDVVFYGTMDGWFKAVHAKTGELLWKHKVQSGVIGQPITYRGPDGKQYVAVFAGVGGWAGAIVSGDLDARDPTAALGMVAAMKDLKAATQKGGRLYVFSL